MLLHDTIIAAYNEGFSGIYVKCSVPNETAQLFQEKFDIAFHQAMDDAEEFYGAPCMEKCDELDCPSSIVPINENTFLIRLGPLFLSMNDGARADNDYLINALETTLKELTADVPGLSYWGMIAYEWYDEHCADIVSYTIASDNFTDEGVLYPYIKDIFDEIINDDDSEEEFLEKIADSIEGWDFDDEPQIIIEQLNTYNVDKCLIQKIQEIIDNN